MQALHWRATRGCWMPNLRRLGQVSRVASILCLLAAPGWAGDDRDKRLGELDDLTKRLNRYATESIQSPERRFLHDRVSDLLSQARDEIGNGYRFGRLVAAMDDLLDASDQIEDAYADEPQKSDTRERAARELEDTYFDLKRGEHFAKQSGDRYANDYVKTARKLYQQARAAYEQERFAESRDLGEAAREIVEGLESLAQAAVRIPTPPKL